MDLASFLNAKQIKDLARIISEAELLTSGEIRLHLEEKCEIRSCSYLIDGALTSEECQ